MQRAKIKDTIWFCPWADQCKILYGLEKSVTQYRAFTWFIMDALKKKTWGILVHVRTIYKGLRDSDDAIAGVLRADHTHVKSNLQLTMIPLEEATETQVESGLSISPMIQSYHKMNLNSTLANHVKPTHRKSCTQAKRFNLPGLGWNSNTCWIVMWITIIWVCLWTWKALTVTWILVNSFREYAHSALWTLGVYWCEVLNAFRP